MDALMGLALFGAGMTAGGGLIVSYYRSLKGVQDSLSAKLRRGTWMQRDATTKRCALSWTTRRTA